MTTLQTHKPPLSGLLPDEIYSLCNMQKPFHALQAFQWIARGVISFDAMTNLSQTERIRLDADYCIYNTSCSTILKDPDGTIKLGIDLFDNSRIETVLLFDKNGRKTACVSCQVGCPMGCAFCQTAQVGFLRNLTANEITEQFFHLERIAGTLDNIVFMGMGEPLLNILAIEQSISVLTHPKGRNLSRRRITLSTSGICKGIYELADSSIDIRLAVSLTAADERLRTQLMPVTKANPLSELKKAIAYFNEKKGKRVTLELALLKQVNTSRAAAAQVADFARGLDVHINLIPWNPVADLPFETPSDSEVRAFHRFLTDKQLNVTLRQKRGRTIGGACGQLGKKGSPQ